MKAYTVNAKDRKRMQKIANDYANQRQNDIAKRSTYLVLLACMQAGLSAHTMRRIINELPAVTEAYAEYKTEKLGDDFARFTLQHKGVDLPETENKQ